MPEHELLRPLLALAFLLALSGFFSGSETALMAVSRYRLRYLERRGERRAGLLLRLTATPDRLLSAILLGNNFVNIAASALATTVALRLVGGSGGVLLATFVMTALILVFSEIAPKTYAARNPEKVALAVAVPMRWTVAALGPFARGFAAAATGVLYPFVGRATEGSRVSLEEIKGILDVGEEERVIAREKRRMLQSIFRLTETTIEDVMVPRTQIHAIPLDATPAEVIATIRRSGNTRLPVYRDNLDDVIGILHSKDVFRYWDRIERLRVGEIMRRPLFVPETATLEAVLRLFRHHRQHLALVIDEFGGVEGLVTLEDLLEEIVGDIEDEHDRPQEPQLLERDDGSVLVEGSCPLSLLNRRYGLELRARDAYTVAGLLMEVSGGIPQPGERIAVGDVTFNVRRASRNRVDLVRVEAPRIAAHVRRHRAEP